MSKSMDDLQAAFAGESQANRKYLAFAKKAEEDGFPQIAKVFRAAAAAETIHAHNHLKAMGGLKSTIENIQAAIEGEHYEFSEMYPAFIEDAKKDGNEKALKSFSWANEVEKIHHKLYLAALEAAKKKEDLPEKPMYVCPYCGYTLEGEPEGDCPICGAKKETFMKIE